MNRDPLVGTWQPQPSRGYVVTLPRRPLPAAARPRRQVFLDAAHHLGWWWRRFRHWNHMNRRYGWPR